MDSYSLMFCVVRVFMVFSGLGLKSPGSGFQFYSSSSLQLYSTDNKTSRLMVKRFSTMRIIERFTELHEEEEREEGDRDELEEKKRDSREKDLCSFLFPEWSP